MVENIANLQSFIIGAIFLWTGGWKVFAPKAGEVAVRSALSILVPGRSSVQIIYRLIGGVEMMTATLLLLPSYAWWKSALAAALSTMFIAYLVFAMRTAPDRPCGCMAGREVSISWRSIARAGLVLTFCLVGLKAQDFWLITITTNPSYLVVIFLEALLFVRLSPELDWTWNSERAESGQSHTASDCATAPVPLSDSLQQLRSSTVFQSLSKFLKSDLTDHWREGCWRYLCFEAEYKGHRGTAIFAVPILGESDRVRASIVDEVEQLVLLGTGIPIT